MSRWQQPPAEVPEVGRAKNRQKVPKDKPDDHDDDGDEDGDGDNQKPHEYCTVCNAYLRPGQKMSCHLWKYCVGPRGFAGDFICRLLGCAARYCHYHDLQHHWLDKHPGVEQQASMKAYIP